MAPRNKTAGKGAGQSGRSPNRGVPKSGSNASSDKTKQSLDDLSDIVFDVGDNRTADGYITAKKRLVEYVSSTFDQGAEIGISIETGTLCVIPIPADPVTPIITPAVPAVPAIAAVPARAAVPFIAAVAADPGRPTRPLTRYRTARGQPVAEKPASARGYSYSRDYRQFDAKSTSQCDRA